MAKEKNDKKTMSKFSPFLFLSFPQQVLFSTSKKMTRTIDLLLDRRAHTARQVQLSHRQRNNHGSR